MNKIIFGMSLFLLVLSGRTNQLNNQNRVLEASPYLEFISDFSIRELKIQKAAIKPWG